MKGARNVSGKVSRRNGGFAERMSIFSVSARCTCLIFMVQVAQVGAHACVRRERKGIRGAHVALLTFRESCATETAGRRVRRSYSRGKGETGRVGRDISAILRGYEHPQRCITLHARSRLLFLSSPPPSHSLFRDGARKTRICRGPRDNKNSPLSINFCVAYRTDLVKFRQLIEREER